MMLTADVVLLVSVLSLSVLPVYPRLEVVECDVIVVTGGVIMVVTVGDLFMVMVVVVMMSMTVVNTTNLPWASKCVGFCYYRRC